jgi:Mg-chelatase subunit ChlD
LRRPATDAGRLHRPAAERHFTGDTAGAAPVGGLAATSLRILEDGARISPTESHETLVRPEVAAEHDTLLLVDTSGSVVKSHRLPALQAAATELLSQVEGGNQRVAVYALTARSRSTPSSASRRAAARQAAWRTSARSGRASPQKPSRSSQPMQ